MGPNASGFSARLWSSSVYRNFSIYIYYEKSGFLVFLVFMSERLSGKKRKRVEDIIEDSDAPIQKKAVLSRYWFLTWNNYEVDSYKVLLNLSGLERYCVQEEKGAQGTPHLQGVLVFKHKKSYKWMRRSTELKCWFKVCRNIFAAKTYCSKEDEGNGKRWVKGFIVRSKVVVDPLEGKELYDWQKEILSMVREAPDDRKVYWYWSAKGNVGKSVLCKHMVLKEEAIVVGGAFRDAYYAIMQRVSKKVSVNVVVFALSRSQGNKVSYIAIEGIKDGMFFSPKYESGMCVYNPPHVLVFANSAPDLSMLSEDRWVVKCLDEVPVLETWQDAVIRRNAEEGYGGLY